LGSTDLKECVNCGAGLLAVSDICPQCGWQKNKLDESKEEKKKIIENESPIEEIKTESTKEIKLENRIPRPFGIRLLGSFLISEGIFMVIFGIIFGSAVIFLVMLSGMGSLGGIGDVGNMPILPGMDGMDAGTMSSLDMIIGLNEIMGSPSASEIQQRLSSSEILNMDLMMEIITEASIISIIEISLGIFAVVLGRGLSKGKKWARVTTIVTAIVSVPLVVIVVDGIDNLIILGMVAFDGIVLYYMFKPKVREYFSQTSKSSSGKKSKQKTI
jgi:hypothetical protein